MNNIDLEIEYKANKLLNRVKRGKFTQAEMTIVNLYDDIQQNEKEEVIENIIDAAGDVSESEVQKLLVDINSFINNTRLWRLKVKKARTRIPVSNNTSNLVFLYLT
jgi:catalase